MYLGIDIGTSAVKAIALTADGEIAAQTGAPLAVARPHPGWSEQDPQAWWAATEAAVLALAPEMRSQVEAIGLAGQMHGATLLDAHDRPLRPAILWNDGRSARECIALELAEPASRTITGNLAMPGFTAPKLLWLRTHEPDLFEQVCTVLLPKDFVRLRMTGDKASDMSDSAGTLWLDVTARDWSDAMLGACGLDRSHVPTLHEGSEATGTLRPEIAERWGMARVPVAAGGGDNAAGAAGVGVVREGQALLSLGTSGVTFVATDAFRPSPDEAVHAFCHCLPGIWHQMAVHLSAAACIDWAARLMNLGGPADVFALAEESEGGDELFLPYLSGERTPYNDTQVRGAFLGAGNDTGPVELAAAVIEGVAFAHAEGLAELRRAGSAVTSLTVVGGGARSRHWGGIIAAALDARLDYVAGGEVGPALGAAKLGMMAATGAPASEVCAPPRILKSIEPDSALAERLAPKFERYRAASAAVRAL